MLKLYYEIHRGFGLLDYKNNINIFTGNVLNEDFVKNPEEYKLCVLILEIGE